MLWPVLVSVLLEATRGLWSFFHASTFLLSFRHPSELILAPRWLFMGLFHLFPTTTSFGPISTAPSTLGPHPLPPERLGDSAQIGIPWRTYRSHSGHAVGPPACGPFPSRLPFLQQVTQDAIRAEGRGAVTVSGPWHRSGRARGLGPWWVLQCEPASGSDARTWGSAGAGQPTCEPLPSFIQRAERPRC